MNKNSIFHDRLNHNKITFTFIDSETFHYKRAMWFLKFTSLAKVTQTADEPYTLRNYAWLLRRCSKLLRLHNDSPHSFLRIQSLCHKKILQFIQICINSKNAFHKRVMSKWRLVTFLGNQLKYYALSFWEYRVTKMKQSEQKIVCIWNSCVTTAAIRMKSGTGSCVANYIWMLKPSRERFYSSFGISWIKRVDYGYTDVPHSVVLARLNDF